jgi:hypothetical protein
MLSPFGTGRDYGILSTLHPKENARDGNGVAEWGSKYGRDCVEDIVPVVED